MIAHTAGTQPHLFDTSNLLVSHLLIGAVSFVLCCRYNLGFVAPDSVIGPRQLHHCGPSPAAPALCSHVSHGHLRSMPAFTCHSLHLPIAPYWVLPLPLNPPLTNALVLPLLAGLHRYHATRVASLLQHSHIHSLPTLTMIFSTLC